MASVSKTPQQPASRNDHRHLRRWIAFGGILLASLNGQGCFDYSYSDPTPLPRKQTGFEQCATINALYCNSYSIPQVLADGVPGACCATVNSNSSVGYLCAYGANRAAAGCFLTLEDARTVCWDAPSIVRCTR